MEITSLESIETFTKEGLFDIHTGYFLEGLNLKIKIITLDDTHTGRPWKLCNDLYQNTKDIDIICDINGIYNALTIKAGDTIFYVEKDDINIVRNAKQSGSIADAVNKIKSANKGKEQKSDKNRVKDKANEKQREKEKLFNGAKSTNDSGNKQNVNSANIINNSQGNILFEEGKITLFPNF